MLTSAGFSEVKSIGHLEGRTFCRDPHCGDVLVLPGQLKAQLYSTKLPGDHKLIIQVQAVVREEAAGKKKDGDNLSDPINLPWCFMTSFW